MMRSVPILTVKWTEEHQEAALNLYEKIEGPLPDGNSAVVQKAANEINIAPMTLGYKLANFRYLDPSEEKKGKKGSQRS